MKIQSSLKNIEVNKIHPHPDNPRKDTGDISEMVKSVQVNGIMQNLTVIPHPEKQDEYRCLIGHRRLAAAKEAGLEKVPCRVVYDMPEKEQLTVMLEENMQRNDLTIYEQAQGFQMMLDLGETIESLKEKTGFSESTIRHRVHLAELDGKILKEKENNNDFQLTLKDLYELEKINDVELKNEILKEATSSENLRFRVKNKLRKMKEDEIKAGMIAELEELGAGEMPEEDKEKIYMHWTIARSIYRFESEEAEGIKEEIRKILQEGKEYCYVNGEYNLSIYERRTDTNTELSEEQKEQAEEAKKERRQREENHNRLRELYDHFEHQVGDFLIDMTSYSEEVKESVQKNVINTIWNLMIVTYTDIDWENLYLIMTGKDVEDAVGETDSYEEEKTKTKEILSEFFDKVPVWKQMLAASAEIISPPFYYSSEYITDNGEKDMKVYALLAAFGFNVDKETEKMLDGTSELYMND